MPVQFDAETAESLLALAPRVVEDVATLMVSMAMGDEHLAAEEVQKVVEILNESFGMELDDAVKLTAHVVQHVYNGGGDPACASKLNDSLSAAQKLEVLLMLMQVVAADGERTAVELDVFDDVYTAWEIEAETMHQVWNRYFDSQK